MLSNTVLLITSLLAIVVPAVVTHKRFLLVRLAKAFYYFGASLLCLYSLLLLCSSSVEVLTASLATAYTTACMQFDQLLLTVHFIATQSLPMSTPSYATTFFFLVCCFLLYLLWHSKMVDDLGSPNNHTTATTTNDQFKPTSTPTDAVLTVMNNNLTSITSALTGLLTALSSTSKRSAPPQSTTATSIPTSSMSSTTSQEPTTQQLHQDLKSLHDLVANVSKTLMQFEALMKPMLATVNSLTTLPWADFTAATVPNETKTPTLSETPRVYPVTPTPTPTNNAASPTENATAESRPFNILDHLNLSEEELCNLLMQRRAANREVKTSLKFLSADEKRVAVADLSELARQWRRQRNPSYQFKNFDFESIGQLTPEEADLPRNNVQEIITARKHAVYVARARAAGRMLIQCKTCGELTVENSNHRCLQLPWGSTTTKRGVPRKDHFVVNVSGRNTMKISNRPTVDLEEIKTQFDKFKKIQILENAKKVPTSEVNQGTAGTRTTDLTIPPPPPTDDATMMNVTDYAMNYPESPIFSPINSNPDDPTTAVVTLTADEFKTILAAEFERLQRACFRTPT